MMFGETVQVGLVITPRWWKDYEQAMGAGEAKKE